MIEGLPSKGESDGLNGNACSFAANSNVSYHGKMYRRDTLTNWVPLNSLYNSHFPKEAPVVVVGIRDVSKR